MTSPGRRPGPACLLMAALILSWLSPACRLLTICDESCSAASGAGGERDDPDASAGSVSSGGSASAPEGGASGAGGEVGEAAGAGARLGSGAGGQADTPSENDAGAPSCTYPRGECDGTLQTVCESDLDWNARNCGGCNRACDGACSQSSCSLEAPVFEGGEVTAVLADERHYYFLTFRGQLIRVDVVWGEAEVLASNLDAMDSPDSLARTEDSIYVWAEFSPLVQRVALESGEVVLEEFDATSFGASRAGIYYDNEQGLWFEPAVVGDAIHLTTQGVNILCSSASLVLFETEWPDSSLYFARGAELTRVGTAPDYIERAVCATDAALLLNPEQAIRVSAAGVDAPMAIPESRYLAEQSLPAFDGTSFSLAYRTRGHAHIRTFQLAASVEDSIVGLPNDARLVHRDTNYLWYNAPDPPRLSPQLKRARLP